MKAGQGARGGREAKARYIGLIWEKMTKQMVSRWWLLFTHNLTYICGQTSGLLLNGHEKTFIYGCSNKSLCVYILLLLRSELTEDGQVVGFTSNKKKIHEVQL